MWLKRIQVRVGDIGRRLTSCGPCPSCRWRWGSGPAGVGPWLASCWTSSGLLRRVSSFPPKPPSHPRGGASAARNDFAAGRGRSYSDGQSAAERTENSKGFQGPPTSLSASFSSASFSFTLWTNICLISSSLFCSSTRNSWRLASYVCCKLFKQQPSEELVKTARWRHLLVSPLDGSPDWFALWSCVFESHFLQLAASVQLVVASVSLLSQILHVHADQHLPQFHKVTVVFILHWQKIKRIPTV